VGEWHYTASFLKDKIWLLFCNEDFSDFARWYGLPSEAGVLFFYRAILLRAIVRLLGLWAKRCLQPPLWRDLWRALRAQFSEKVLAWS
jgi:hypothetical protein